MQDKRFDPVNLSFNIGSALDKIGNVLSCNSGGSVICDTGTGGCGSAGMTCVGTSCSGSSATKVGFDSQIRINPAELESLQKELMNVVARFAR